MVGSVCPFKVTALHCKQKQSDGPRVYMSFNRRENMTQLARLFTVKHLQERVAERFLFDLKGFKVHLKHRDSHLGVACGWNPNCSNIQTLDGTEVYWKVSVGNKNTMFCSYSDGPGLELISHSLVPATLYQEAAESLQLVTTSCQDTTSVLSRSKTFYTCTSLTSLGTLRQTKN